MHVLPQWHRRLCAFLCYRVQWEIWQWEKHFILNGVRIIYNIGGLYSFTRPSTVKMINIARLILSTYVLWMEDNVPCRKINFSQPEGSRKKWRPGLRWLNSVLKDLKTLELNEWMNGKRKHGIEIWGVKLSRRPRHTRVCSATREEEYFKWTRLTGKNLSLSANEIYSKSHILSGIPYAFHIGNKEMYSYHFLTLNFGKIHWTRKELELNGKGQLLICGDKKCLLNENRSNINKTDRQTEALLVASEKLR